MKKRISNISIVQSSKLFTLIAFILTAVIAWPLAIYAFFTTGEGMGSLALLLAPFLYALMTFVIYVITFFLYNLAAGFVGGIEVNLEDHLD